MITTIYGTDCPDKSLVLVLQRLTNLIWKLIPMYENEEDWLYLLENVILETSGLSHIFFSVPEFVALLANLEGLRITKDEAFNFRVYRHTIFESINTIQGLVKRYESR